MYCPNCSQQQVSEEMRFCSRCGFPLSGVRELIARGGVLVERETEAREQLSKAFRGMRKGLWVWLTGLVLLLFVGILTAINDGFAVFLLLPALCFIVGFALLLYGAFVQGRKVKKEVLQPSGASKTPAQIPVARGPELPPAHTAPVESFPAQKIRTAEMVHPPSVTESTTRLLDDEAASPRR